MLFFPQLATGALAQYPIIKQLSQRNVRSSMEDGTTISMVDRGAKYLRWQISLYGLSNLEANSLRAFFTATQGNFLAFTFLDPTANLLVWSEDFGQRVWETAGVALDNKIADPWGDSRASRANNGGVTDLTIGQETQIPGFTQICFSVYLRATSPITAGLTRTAGSHSQFVPAAVGNSWQRFYLSGILPGVTDLSRFAITVPAGISLELFGPQLDAQVIPSAYIPNGGSSDVYTNAHFDMKQLDLTSTAPNRNGCVVYIRCNLPAGE